MLGGNAGLLEWRDEASTPSFSALVTRSCRVCASTTRPLGSHHGGPRPYSPALDSHEPSSCVNLPREHIDVMAHDTAAACSPTWECACRAGQSQAGCPAGGEGHTHCRPDPRGRRRRAGRRLRPALAPTPSTLKLLSRDPKRLWFGDAPLRAASHC